MRKGGQFLSSLLGGGHRAGEIPAELRHGEVRWPVPSLATLYSQLCAWYPFTAGWASRNGHVNGTALETFSTVGYAFGTLPPSG